MNTSFMNFENIKTSEPHRILLNLTDKINLKCSDKYVVLSNLSIYYTWKNTKVRNLKLLCQSGMINQRFVIDHILQEIIKIIFSISSKILKK